MVAVSRRIGRRLLVVLTAHPKTFSLRPGTAKRSAGRRAGGEGLWNRLFPSGGLRPRPGPRRRVSSQSLTGYYPPITVVSAGSADCIESNGCKKEADSSGQKGCSG